MKNTLLKSLGIALLAILIISCSKEDDTPSFQKENFLAEFLTLTQFEEETGNNVNSGDYEFGLEFTPTVKGNITSINVQLPDASPELRVTFWDTETKTVIRSETVNVELADTSYNFSIDDLALVKDKKYMITMNSDDWYTRTKTDNSEITYPISVGNIDISNYGFFSGSDQTYPDSFHDDYYAGDLAFDFQRTE